MPATTILICPLCGHRGEAFHCQPGPEHNYCMLFHLYYDHTQGEPRFTEEQRRFWSASSMDDTLPGNITTQEQLNQWFIARNIPIVAELRTQTAPASERNRMEGNRYYIAEENGVAGIWRQAPPVRVQGVEKLLESVAMNMGCAVNGAFSCGDRLVRLNCKNGYVVMSCPIRQLNLKTTFSVRNGFLVPELNSENEDFLDLNLPWLVPPGIKLYFAVKALPNLWRPQHACLFARIDGQQGNFRLPISNTYGDGRVCLGRTYDANRCNSLQELMALSLNLLDNSSWNSDLYEEGWRIASTHEMFKFKAETREPVYSANPAAVCVKCNNATIEEAI